MIFLFGYHSYAISMLYNYSIFWFDYTYPTGISPLQVKLITQVVVMINIASSKKCHAELLSLLQNRKCIVANLFTKR